MILAVALQRVCAPSAKTELPAFIASCVPRLSLRPAKDFNGAAFHRVTRDVTETTYDEIQRVIAEHACKEFELKTDVLAFDTTNFDTFIDTTTKGKLAKRGHAKSKRADLRVVGLALMTSGTWSVPLFHRAYAGNVSDKTVLAKSLKSLATLHESLGRAQRTLVRDGGFAGDQLELDLVQSGYHSLTTLALNTTLAREAMTQAIGHMRRLRGKLSKVRAFRCVGELEGEKRTLVVSESPDLLKGQLRGMRKAKRRALGELRKMARRLRLQRKGKLKGRPATLTSLRKKVDELLAQEHLSEFLHVTLGGTEEAPTLTFRCDLVARRKLIRERLGKRVLLTDQSSWSTSRIVKAFRSQWKVERAFRRMKRGGISTWGPSFQWTDASLRAHTFAVVLGLQLASLVGLHLHRAGLGASTKKSLALLRELRVEVIRERTGQRGRPRESLIPRKISPEALRAANLFELGKWGQIISTTT
jgi:transposase